MHNTIKNTTSLLLALLLGLSLTSYAQEDYEWSRLNIGGGGYVTGIFFHPAVPGLKYVRSDVVAPYRMDPGSDTWQYLGDEFSPATGGRVEGSEGIAVHPTDPDVVFAFIGDYPGEERGLFKSTNRGEDWEKVLPVRADGGNSRAGIFGSPKFQGEPIAVDPNNPNYVYAGTQWDGVFLSTGAGEAGTFLSVASVPSLDAGTANQPGTRSVVIDPGTTIASPTRSRYVYLSVEGQGVWLSTDGGSTFAPMPNAPQNPLRMVLSPNGSLYVANAPGLWKYTPGSPYQNGTWTDVSPAGKNNTYFIGLDIDPNDANRILTTIPDGPLYRSSNGGTNWSAVSRAEGTIRKEVVNGFNFFRDPGSGVLNVRFDPYSDDVYLCDAYAIWKCTDIFAPVTEWVIQYKGFNNTITIDLAAPPASGRNGTVYSGSPDVEGFRFDDVDQPFTTKYSRLGPNATTVDFCEEFPDVMYIAKQQKWQPVDQGRVFRTSDGFTNNSGEGYIPDENFFKSYPDDPSIEGPGYGVVPPNVAQNINIGGAKLSVSATDSLNVVYFSGHTVQSTKYTRDGGASWQDCQGLPSGGFMYRVCGGGECSEYDFNRPLAADRVSGQHFYAYHDKTSTFWASEDGGASWREEPQASADLPAWTGQSQVNPYRMEAAPYIAGTVWIALGENGLFASDNFGQSFTKISYFDRASQMTWGRNQPGRSNPTAFVYGLVGTQWGIYRSVDLGSNWTLISPSNKPGEYPRCMAGDRRVFGQVYAGQASAGIRYGRPSGVPVADTPPTAPSAVTVTAINSNRVEVQWQDNASNETKFRLYRSLSAEGPFVYVGMVGYNTTRAEDGNLKASTPYYYRVRALNPDGFTDSPVGSGTTLSDSDNVTVSVSASEARVAEGGSDSVRVQLRLDRAATAALVINVTLEGSAQNGIDYQRINETVTVAAGDTVATVYVAPIADANPGEADETVVITIVSGEAYVIGGNNAATVTIVNDGNRGKPSNLTTTVLGANRVRLTWTDNATGEQSFLIERQEGEGTFIAIDSIKENSRAYLDLNSLKEATSYTYRVRIKGPGLSEPTDEVSVSTPAAPVGYAQGFVWKRASDWDAQTGNPDDDANGGLVWDYFYIEDNQQTTDGKDSPTPWWERETTRMDTWFTDKWGERGGNNPFISSQFLEERRDNLSGNVYLGIPVVSWTNPTGQSIELDIQDTLLADFVRGTNTRSVDIVILHKTLNGYTKIYEGRETGTVGDAFSNSVSISLMVAPGEQVWISLHQNSVRFDNTVALYDNLTFTIGDGTVNASPVARLVMLDVGTVFTEGTSETVTIEASDDVAVRKVQLYADEQLVGEDSVAPYSIPLTGLSEGTYRLSARAVDAEGAVGLSDRVKIHVITPETILLDNDLGPEEGVLVTGFWQPTSWEGAGAFYGKDWIQDRDEQKGEKSVRYTPTIPQAGEYEVYITHPALAGWATNVPVQIQHAGGSDVVTVNQQEGGGEWKLLGSYSFVAGNAGYVEVRTDTTNGRVQADAIKFVYTGTSEHASETIARFDFEDRNKAVDNTLPTGIESVTDMRWGGTGDSPTYDGTINRFTSNVYLLSWAADQPGDARVWAFDMVVAPGYQLSLTEWVSEIALQGIGATANVLINDINVGSFEVPTNNYQTGQNAQGSGSITGLDNLTGIVRVKVVLGGQGVYDKMQVSMSFQ